MGESLYRIVEILVDEEATRSSTKTNRHSPSEAPLRRRRRRRYFYFVLRLCFFNSYDGQEAAGWNRYNSRRSSTASPWRFLPSPPFLLPYLSAYLCTCWLCFRLFCCSVSPPFLPCCSSWSPSLNSLSWRNLGTADSLLSMLSDILMPHCLLLFDSLYCFLLFSERPTHWGCIKFWFGIEIILRCFGTEFVYLFDRRNSILEIFLRSVLLNQHVGKWKEIWTWYVGYRSIEFLLWL